MTINPLALVLQRASALVLESVPTSFRIHSVYCYNLSAIETTDSAEYRLEKVRDGRNFSIRFVEISQKNKPTYILEFSLQNIANIDLSFTYTPKFPQVELPKSGSLREKSLSPSRFLQFCEAESNPNLCAFWIKLDDSAPFDHEDVPLLMISGYGFISEDLDRISEHSVWIHENGFNRGDLLLLELERKYESAKTTFKGRIWSQGGKLLLSFIQERNRKTRTSNM